MPHGKDGQITELDADEIFVFGSNTAGRHGRGAARTAYNLYDAAYGVGEGLTGRSYALPTKTYFQSGLLTRSTIEIAQSIEKFYTVARENPGKKFIMTKVGCGLAEIPEYVMQDLFLQCGLIPSNVVRPPDWASFEHV